MSEDVGRVGDADQALVNEAPAGLHPSGFDPSREERSWPLCGYAPGNYFCRCSQCGEQFDGDKRALECLECAAKSARFIMANGRSLKSALINLHDTLRLWSEFGGPALPKQVEDAMRQAFDALRDSDGSSEAGETHSGSTVGDSAGRETASPNADRTPA